MKKQLSGLIILLLLGSGLAVPTFQESSFAQSKSSYSKRGELKRGGSTRVYAQKCALRVSSTSSDKRLIIKCSGKQKVKPRESTLGTILLSAGEDVRLTGRNCSPTVKFVSRKFINVVCNRVSEIPVETPTATPTTTAVATTTPLPTATPTATATPTFTPTPTADLIFLTANVVTVPVNNSLTFQVQNQSATVTALDVRAELPASWTDVSLSTTNVSQSVANCTNLAPGEVCSFTMTAGNTARAQADVPIRGLNTNTALMQIEVIPVTTLTSNVNNVNLAVNDTALNAALTGTPRIIIVTNTGGVAAQNLTVNFSTAPSGTTMITSCGSTLAAAASCTVTITPGSSASAVAADTNPSPITIDVTSDNSNSLALTANVVTYGSVIEGGVVYSVDDTTPNTGSIGGKVASLVDQAEPYTTAPQASSIIWASNGNANIPDFTSILGIDETSTTSVPSPSNPAYPGGTPGFTACNGNTDGQCNSDNILSYYNFNRTAGGSAPTPLNLYSAGLCTATINGFSDWYLPAICLLNAVSNPDCPAGAQSMQGSLDIFVGDPNAGTPATACVAGSGCLAGAYWSSTEHSAIPDGDAWYAYFESGGSSFPSTADKDNQFGVRCSRDF